MPACKPASFCLSKVGRSGFLLGAVLFLALLLPAPAPAHAASRVWPTGYWASVKDGGLLSCTGNYNDVVPSGQNGGTTKKCTDLCDLLHTAQNITDFAITLVIFVGAPAMITLGGLLLLFAGGADERRKTAKDVIVSALVGIAITLGAYLILSTFFYIVGNPITGPGGKGSGIKVGWPNVDCVVPPPQVTSS